MLGSSIPIVFLPGIGACIFTALAASARAISLSRLTILLTFVPAFISTSYCVTAGPTWAATTLPSIPKSLNTVSNIGTLALIAVSFSFVLVLDGFERSVIGG